MSEINNSLSLIREIQQKIPDCCFVGGVSEYFQGFKNSFFDIDLCILQKDLKQLEFILGGSVENRVMFSRDLIERRLFRSSEYIVDIFVVSKIPDCIEIDGIRVNTLKELILSKKHFLENKEFINEKQEKKNIESLQRLKNIEAWQKQTQEDI